MYKTTSKNNQSRAFNNPSVGVFKKKPQPSHTLAVPAEERAWKNSLSSDDKAWLAENAKPKKKTKSRANPASRKK